MDLVHAQIFIGDREEATQHGMLLAHGINCVFNVAIDVNDPPYPDILSVKCGLHDAHHPLNVVGVDTAVTVLSVLVDHGYTILVHCHQGMNRAPYVVAKYLGRKRGRCWRKEFEAIIAQRPIAFIKDWMR